MLRNLHVKNLALIEEAEVDFTEGLNVLTGETGAGKSIIIGSINLALGEKVPKEMLRDNDDTSLVELIFEVPNDEIAERLRALDIFLEDGQVILSRRISGGRSVAKINGESVPVSKVREVAALLIDMHGQHEHESLLKKQKHMEILDEYAREELASRKEELRTLYREYRAVCSSLEETGADEESRQRELSLLEYEIHEIEAAHLMEGEDEELELRYRKLSNSRKIIESLQNAHQLLAEQNDSASELTGRALRELSSVENCDEEIQGMSEQLLNIDNLLNDLNRELAAYLQDGGFDEENFRQTEGRLDELNHLKAKYGRTLGDVMAALEERRERGEQLLHYDAYRQELLEKKAKLMERLREVSSQVSDIRKSYGGSLAEQVRMQLADLNFLDVQFEAVFTSLDHFTEQGTDDVEFQISTNPGEPLKPLHKVASGGELSRIMLALKTVLARQDDIGSLIFDEIDAGISGRTAQMVSEKMHVIASTHQVICISHLPQIAAMADTHFLIEKSVENDTTISTIRSLTEEERVEELARMLGGVKITDTVLESAREMRQLAEKSLK